MPDRDTSTDDIERDEVEQSPTDRGTIRRRGLLGALAAGLGGTGLARSSLAREIGVDALAESQFVVEQGDRCVPITPLSGEETAEEFYDYRTPNTDPSGAAYSSYGTTDLQRAETSIVFLYDGPEGLSLVVVHDKLRDGTPGGAATFDLSFAHSDRGAWVVGDDIYDGPTNYDTFTQTATGWTVDWTWDEGRSDGGVYRPLGDDFTVTIDPTFGEGAALYGDYYTGEITDWQFLSGDRSAPERVPLALDRPITIRAGACGGTTTTTTTETTTDEESRTDGEDSSEPIRATVEVVPGKVNPRSRGRLPVVVRSDDEFDATAIAPGSVTVSPGSARPAKRVRTDHDGDDHPDLKLHFWMDALDVDWSTDRLKLTAETEDGRRVVGTGDLELVPNGRDDEDEAEEKKREEREEKREEQAEKREEKREENRDEEAEDDEEEADDEGGDEEEDEKDDDEDEKARGNGPGKGHGNGNGRGRGNGGGRGRGRGKGRGRGNGNGHGNDKHDEENDD